MNESVRGICGIVGDLHPAGVIVFLVEQNASLAVQSADRATCWKGAPDDRRPDRRTFDR